MLHCLGKLFHLPVTVQHLQDTGVGRTVNALRKYEGDTGEAAKALVAKWKAMVAAEDSSEGERESHPEENNSPEEERHNHRHDEYHRSDREKVSHHHRADSKKHKEEERLVKLKKMSSQGQGKKRRSEGENREIVEKRRWKDETDSEFSGCGNSLQAVGQEDNDSGHDSEPRRTSQVSQNVVDNSSDDGTQSPCVQSHSNKFYDSHRKHEKHKVTNTSNKEKVESRQKGDKISSSHEGVKKTENKSVNESKQKKDFKRKVEIIVGNKEHHNDTSKKHKSKTGSCANNIPNVSESPSKPIKLDKTSVKIKKANLSAKEEEDGSIDCSTGMNLCCHVGPSLQPDVLLPLWPSWCAR
jgi:transcription elongation factor B polypeptide 3